MLILSLRLGEEILIGENIVLTLTGLNLDKVQVGIEAPKEVSIVRKSLIQHRQRKESKDGGNKTV